MINDKDSSYNAQILLALTKKHMPYGKYKGRVICDLPEAYLAWFNRKGFPPGELGILLSSIYEIKANGLEHLLKPLKGADGGQ
jgi:uncharacterized protein (DUF3820 family)